MTSIFQRAFARVAACIALLLVFTNADGAPALLPAPGEVRWTDENFDASRFVINAPTEAGFAVEELGRILTGLGGQRDEQGGKIILQLGDTGNASPES